jgi:hypothetical protein
MGTAIRGLDLIVSFFKGSFKDTIMTEDDVYIQITKESAFLVERTFSFIYYWDVTNLEIMLCIF